MHSSVCFNKINILLYIGIVVLRRKFGHFYFSSLAIDPGRQEYLWFFLRKLSQEYLFLFFSIDI